MSTGCVVHQGACGRHGCKVAVLVGLLADRWRGLLAARICNFAQRSRLPPTRTSCCIAAFVEAASSPTVHPRALSPRPQTTTTSQSPGSVPQKSSSSLHIAEILSNKTATNLGALVALTCSREPTSPSRSYPTGPAPLQPCTLVDTHLPEALNLSNVSLLHQPWLKPSSKSAGHKTTCHMSSAMPRLTSALPSSPPPEAFLGRPLNPIDQAHIPSTLRPRVVRLSE